MKPEESGRLGGEAKAARVSAEAAALLRDLPSLNSDANAQVRLEVISDLAMRGLLPGSMAGAAVNAVRVWLAVEEMKLDRSHLQGLEREVASLRKQLADRSGVRRVG